MSGTECLDFAEMLEQEFLKLYYEYADGKPESRKPHIIDSFWYDLYKIIFKPTQDQILYNRCKSRLLPYMVLDMEAVTEMYISLCYRYHGVIKHSCLATLLGYDYKTFIYWSKCNNTDNLIFTLNDSQYDNDLSYKILLYKDGKLEYINNGIREPDKKELSKTRYDVHKRISQEIYNENTNDLSTSTVGQVVRANNDRDVGKLYAVDNAMIQNDVKSIESASDRAKRLGISLKE